MRYVYILFFLSLITFNTFAQSGQYTSNDKQAIKHFVAANHLMDDRLFDEAIAELGKAVSADNKFIEAHIQLADLYRRKRDYAAAIDHYRKAIAINPDFNRAVYLKLGEVEVTEAQYEQAKQHLQKYLTFANITLQNMAYAQKLIADCDFAIVAVKNPVAFKPLNLGKGVNSADDEYMPVATADESTLIFTRKINNNEDFYKSEKKDDKWQPATYLSDNINTPNYNEGAQSISQDGHYLFFTGCNRPDGRGKCDIYIAQRRGNGWGKPVGINPPVNTGAWESQPSISADGRTLYFVSNKAGGIGGYDIWKTTLTDKGWTEPENLGPGINTPYDEQSPFIHPDDNTLYFCSNGWPGLGNKDLFVSRLDAAGKWQKPENLGYPINSSGDENGLTLTAHGDYAFFSSNKLQGSGGFDIYTFEMPPKARPKLVTYVKGKVVDAKTKQPIEADVEIIELERNRIVYQDYSGEDDGGFLATLTSGKNYGLNISKTGYLFYSENFSLIGQVPKSPFIINVELSPIEVGKKVVLRNIFFDTNKYDLKTESKAELAKLIQFMNDNAAVKIEISGHTDNMGNDDLNKVLSENRAKEVYNYLVAAKVAASRLIYKGFGETQPIADNNTESGRQLNRRTEFKIIAQ
ncbi:OmpA family protein [Mucilaginibacter sp. UR6-1]|uniref:OmpA family protein n=1 Tax=Mucilaginibacter sp. UR6-1 TaxID=1435643 RepID=UPI001E5702A4|nr:OmpA family protein [Mucilaginibacter sp. UR6-1]MCC8408290.1 OmpA family protein [Mucilaginibacter sp. UR6-1]